MSGAFGTLVEKPKGKRPLVKSRHRWGDDINVDLK
jgi:hypothetical protein